MKQLFKTHKRGGKSLPWWVCTHCGLVNLQNQATKDRLKQGCYLWADEAGR